jgi:hypothetical protein
MSAQRASPPRVVDRQRLEELVIGSSSNLYNLHRLVSRFEEKKTETQASSITRRAAGSCWYWLRHRSRHVRLRSEHGQDGRLLVYSGQ